MKLLISIKDYREALKIRESSFDILDIKNPTEGSLGANFPSEISKIRRYYRDFPISAAAGDMPNLPGLASLASFGLANCRVDYIKIGLYGPREPEEAVYLLQNVKSAVRESDYRPSIIAAAYADFAENSTLNPLLLPEIAVKSGIDGVMIDTLNKSGKNLFDFLSYDDLKTFVSQSAEAGLLNALAGSLKAEDIDLLLEIGTDIVGFRGAVCRDNDRMSEISPEKIDHLYSLINRRSLHNVQS
ncbi:MAG: (5-formylfuran-3-yl)methyl phosphate synthase [Bacillota bacterium]